MMSNGDLNWITNYIWGIANDVLHDLYVPGKYRDVILPMTVLRRLDAVLEGSKQAVLDNHGIGTIFEELVRRFNEAGEHCAPRDAIRLTDASGAPAPKRGR